MTHQEKSVEEILERFWWNNGHFETWTDWKNELRATLTQAKEQGAREEREKIRYSWDIADGTDEWCVQIWHGNKCIDSITKHSDDGGMVKLMDCDLSTIRPQEHE